MRHRRRKKQRKLPLIALFLAVFSLSFGILSLLEGRFLPTIQEISHTQCKAMANQIINTATLEILEKTSLTENILLQEKESYTANTALVNQFCALLSAEITEAVSALSKEVIQIPLGAATKMSFLANTGPEIPFTLLPVGEVSVDYKTDFASVGINQINYKIWILISMEMQIANPLFQESVTLERKIMLADLVFGGKVPEHYFQISRPNEYLLTE